MTKYLLIALIFIACGNSTTSDNIPIDTAFISRLKERWYVDSSFGDFFDQRMKFTTTRCIEWEGNDSVAGYNRKVTFEFIITPDPLIIDTVIVGTSKILMWSDKLSKHPMDDGTFSDVISFWPPQHRHGEMITHKENWDYSTYWVTLWLSGDNIRHVSIGTANPIVHNKHTVYVP